MITPDQIESQLENVRRLGLMSTFQRAARSRRLSPELLLAIASRETGMGTDAFVLANGWTGRDGHGKGIMQLDARFQPVASVADPADHRTNIFEAARLLREWIDEFRDKKAGIAAYNAGSSGVRRALSRGLGPDAATTGGNYSSDVLRRESMIAWLQGSGIFGLSKATFTQSIPALLLLSGGTGFLFQQLKKR